MATKGNTISNQITGQRITFVETAKDTNGARMVMDEYVPANGLVDQEHIHPQQEETFTVLSGTMEFYVRGRRGALRLEKAWSFRPKPRTHSPTSVRERRSCA